MHARANSTVRVSAIFFCNFQTPDSLDPLSLVSRYFREESLQRALETLVTPGNGNGRIDAVLSHVQLSQENNACVDTLRACQDPVAEWWAAALATGALWALDQEEEAAKKYYKVVQTLPEEVKSFCSVTSVQGGRLLMRGRVSLERTFRRRKTFRKINQRKGKQANVNEERLNGMMKFVLPQSCLKI